MRSKSNDRKNLVGYVTVKFPTRLFARLTTFAKDADRSRSSVVRLAVHDYMEFHTPNDTHTIRGRTD